MNTQNSLEEEKERTRLDIINKWSKAIETENKSKIKKYRKLLKEINQTKQHPIYAIIDDDYDDVKPNVELLNQSMRASDSNAASSGTRTSNLNARSKPKTGSVRTIQTTRNSAARLDSAVELTDVSTPKATKESRLTRNLNALSKRKHIQATPVPDDQIYHVVIEHTKLMRANDIDKICTNLDIMHKSPEAVCILDKKCIFTSHHHYFFKLKNPRVKVPSNSIYLAFKKVGIKYVRLERVTRSEMNSICTLMKLKMP